jgi:hypothetical protein
MCTKDKDEALGTLPLSSLMPPAALHTLVKDEMDSMTSINKPKKVS